MYTYNVHVHVQLYMYMYICVYIIYVCTVYVNKMSSYSNSNYLSSTVSIV